MKSKFCKTEQHGWCANRNAVECHCSCQCHVHGRELHKAEVALRTAAVEFATQGPVRDADDTAGQRANRKLLRAARKYAVLVTR